jgi:hypothetical protein
MLPSTIPLSPCFRSLPYRLTDKSLSLSSYLIGPKGVIRESISGDFVGQKPDEGSFWGNRQNVFELGVAHAERVVLAPSPAR